ncbi:uncharacterized protein J4E92_005425 [Alternaria infectoria]|uniref:uncharacterized protein n=1 Tax=Alternaria infectoria TaxID=45303 RepID=UPI00221E5AE6|nr:uncharacterized protein J4E92_005425 [Alternaria infectoria]KAI4927945.1 hypothetical protein J4E92_005425 [Alternaria infectoria]
MDRICTMADTPEDTANSPTEVNNIEGTPAVEPTGNDEGTQTDTPKTDDQLIEDWLGTSLVELKNEHGYTREIGVREYLDITTTRGNNLACWLEAGSLDVAFALLTRRDSSRDVCALPIYQSNDLFNFGNGDCTMEDLLKDGTIEPTLKDGKRFIVVPVNDGLLSNKEIDRQGKEAREAEDVPTEDIEEVEESEVIEGIEDVVRAEDTVEDFPDLERAYEVDVAMIDTPQEGDDNTPEPAIEKTKEGPKKVSKKSKEPPLEPLAVGSHWGLLVVDKETKTARWIDGNITLVKRGRKTERLPRDMSPAARVAGKILCAIEQVLGPERGQYNAKTAKYVPHQFRDNSFKGDGGACGPYVVAFLEYLYKNKYYMSHLRTAFSRRKWDGHCHALDFDSLYTRVEMQKIIQDECEKNAKAGELSLKMTPDVFRILNPKVVAPWVATAWRERTGERDHKGLFDRYHFRKHAAGTHRGTHGPGGPGGGGSGGSGPGRGPGRGNGGSGMGPGGGGGGPGGNNGGKGNGLGGDDGNDSDDSNPDVQTAIRNSLLEGNGSFLVKTPLFKYPAGADHSNLPEFGTLTDAETDAWHKKYENDLFKIYGTPSWNRQTYKAVLHRTFVGSFGGVSNEVLEGYINDTHAFTDEERSQRWDMTSVEQRMDQTYQKIDLPLFASLSPTSIDHWVRNLHPDAKKVIQDNEGNTRYDVAGGLLYRFFVGEFADMPDEDVKVWRAHDPNMIADGKKDIDTARYWLTWYYYRGEAKKTLPYLKESPLHWPHFEHRQAHGQKRKRSRERVDEDDKASTGQPSSPPAKGSENALSDPKSIDWATIDHATLMKHLNQLEQMKDAPTHVRKDSRIGELSNDYTYRAILFVKYGGKFKDEKARSATWVRDLNVFTLGSEDEVPKRDVFYTEGGHLVIRTKAENILERMRKKYETNSGKPVSKATRTSPGRQGRQKRQGPGGSQGLPGPTNPSGSSNQFVPQNVAIVGELLEGSPLDFTYTIQKRLQEWIKRLPEKIAPRIEAMDEWSQKAVLQYLFGGFNEVAKGDRHVWLKQHRLLVENMAFEDAARVLENTAKEFGNEGVLKKDILCYPDYYLAEFQEKNKVLIKTIVDAKKNAGDGNGQSGGKRHEDLSDDDIVDLDDFKNDDETAQPAVGAATQGAKRKHAGGTASLFPAKRHKGDRPDFCTMEEREVLLWLAKVPLTFKKELLDSKLNLLPLKSAYARVMLERIFNKTFQNWAAEDPLTEETLGKLRQWRLLGTFSGSFNANPAGLKKFLDKILYADKTTVGEGKKAKKETVVLPDYSNNKDKWPENWR